ncbi:MAG: hypothetical protein GDA41_10160 [Rhodospirillales bacterium]|nr:hypothetical protein [Rhodospirillales bacterium]
MILASWHIVFKPHLETEYRIDQNQITQYEWRINSDYKSLYQPDLIEGLQLVDLVLESGGKELAFRYDDGMQLIRIFFDIRQMDEAMDYLKEKCQCG